MNIGLFGGTFDPVHIGHLIVASYVLERVGLDQILFIPGATPPHKQDREVSAAEHRLAMLRLAVAGDRRFDVSDAEILRGGVSFTVHTLLEFQRTRPHDGLYFLLGMDNLAEFATWKDPERILQMATLVVMTRPGFTPEPPAGLPSGNLVLCDVPPVGISSSLVRDRSREGKSIRYLVPEGVEQYILARNLYR